MERGNKSKLDRFNNPHTWEGAIEDLVAGRDAVTFDEILRLLPDVEENLDRLEDLFDTLEALGVAVVERSEVGSETLASEQVAQPGEEKNAHETGDVENIVADDVLSLYLAQMAQEPLLNHKEEIELARQIEVGRRAQRELNETECTPEASRRLHEQAVAGQAARERLGRANTRLVVSIAKRYRGCGVPFTDLIQNGNVGLMRAVDRYEFRTGNRFSTYATWWIRQAVTRSLANQGRTIRIPVHTGDRIRRAHTVEQRLEQERGERPTAEEIATEMDETPEKIRQLMLWSIHPLSLEQPAGKEGDVELGQFIPDDEAHLPADLADAGILSEAIEDLLRILTPREARILRLRYGLQDGRTHTLKEVGRKFGLSRERVRQIENEAMTKIRILEPEYQLQQFLD